MVAPSFHGILPMAQNFIKNTCYKFFNFFLHCYRQVASIFTFISDYSVKLLLLKRLRSSEEKNIHVKIAVPQPQESKLYGTKRDAEIEHCNVHNVPISPQYHKMI